MGAMCDSTNLRLGEVWKGRPPVLDILPRPLRLLVPCCQGVFAVCGNYAAEAITVFLVRFLLLRLGVVSNLTTQYIVHRTSYMHDVLVRQSRLNPQPLQKEATHEYPCLACYMGVACCRLWHREINTLPYTFDGFPWYTFSINGPWLNAQSVRDP